MSDYYEQKIGDMQDTIRELEARLEKAEGWISVDDRLPDVGEEKPSKLSWIVTDGDKVWITSMHPANWYHRFFGEKHLQHLEQESYITHWMPLPEPPEERK